MPIILIEDLSLCSRDQRESCFDAPKIQTAEAVEEGEERIQGVESPVLQALHHGGIMHDFTTDDCFICHITRDFRTVCDDEVLGISPQNPQSLIPCELLEVSSVIDTRW